MAEDQIAYQSAYHMAVGKALAERDCDGLSRVDLARLLGELDGEASVVREQLARVMDVDIEGQDTGEHDAED